MNFLTIALLTILIIAALAAVALSIMFYISVKLLESGALGDIEQEQQYFSKKW